MGLKLVTPPATEPISFADVQAHLRLSDDSEQAVVERIIRAAREWCEQYQSRRLVSSTWDLTAAAFPRRAIVPPFSPLVSVTSITYLDPDGALQTLDPADYTVDTISDPGQVLPAYGTCWPNTRCTPNAMTLRHVAGYGTAADVPAATQLALLQLVGHWFENREACALQQVPEALLSAFDNDRRLQL